MNPNEVDRRILCEICNHYKIHPMSKQILAPLFSALNGYNYKLQEIESQDRLMQMFHEGPNNVESISQYVVHTVDNNLYLSMQEDDALAEENMIEDGNENNNNKYNSSQVQATKTNSIPPIAPASSGKLTGENTSVGRGGEGNVYDQPRNVSQSYGMKLFDALSLDENTESGSKRQLQNSENLESVSCIRKNKLCKVCDEEEENNTMYRNIDEPIDLDDLSGSMIIMAIIMIKMIVTTQIVKQYQINKQVNQSLLKVFISEDEVKTGPRMKALAQIQKFLSEQNLCKNKIDNHENVPCYLVNTGWSDGKYGIVHKRYQWYIWW